MIRPLHMRSATALASTRNETSIRSCGFSNFPAPLADNNNTPSWPLLKKRNRPHNQDTLHSGGNSLIQSLKNRQDPPTVEIAVSQAVSGPGLGPKHDSRVMLILQELSPNLNASDFYRLAPSDLSSWQSVIKKVQQQRNPTTLEPLGRYHISFSTATAAISYRDRLLRLHKLAHHKLDTSNGLWESSVPAHLRSPAGDDPASELEGFTVTSGSAKTIEVQRRRVSLKHKWTKHLKEIVEKFEYGDKPPIVLVQIYPPTVMAGEFGRLVREDGISRGCEWKMCEPQELQQPIWGARDQVADVGNEINSGTMEIQQKMINTQEKLKCQFVMICADDAEARRFHRHWNQRPLHQGVQEDTKCKRNVVHASIINW